MGEQYWSSLAASERRVFLAERGVNLPAACPFFLLPEEHREALDEAALAARFVQALDFIRREEDNVFLRPAVPDGWLRHYGKDDAHG